MLSLAIVALYVVPIFTNIAPNGLFGISIWVAIGAGITAIASIIFYILNPQKPTFYPGFIVFMLFTVTTGLVVIQSGGVNSPFIALWMLVSFFAGIFAIWGTLPIFIAMAVFVAAEYLAGRFTPGLIAMVMFSSIVPLIISMFVWRDHGEDGSTKAVKNLANQLSEVANKSEIVINAIGDGVVAIDSQGIIQLINPAGQEILGWGKQDALMLNYKSILKMTDLNNHELQPANDPIQQVLNTNQEARANNLTIVTKTGKKITGSLVVSPVGDAGNGVIVVFRDVTKERAEEREQAEFISTASHEMRTPVASIEGYLGLALNPNTAKIDDKARDFIMKAHEAAQHLGHLFQDLLDVSKSEDGRMINVPKVVDMTAFTGTIVQGLTAKAQEKGLQLTYTPTAVTGQKQIAPVYYVNIDNDHIREVLDNLIENAIKYTLKGEVVVDVTGSDDKVVISVKDSGLGIPPEDIPHLFQKFYRVDNVDRQAIGGTGLGLYLSRRLAESMGGRLWVESVWKQGSTFFLELPRVSGQEAEQLKQQQEAAAKAAAATQASAPATPITTQGSGAPVPGVQGTSSGAPVVSATGTQSEVQAQSAETVPGADTTGTPTVKAATTVPRGESLTREQIAERVRQLESLARAQQPVAERPAEPAATPAPPQVTGQP